MRNIVIIGGSKGIGNAILTSQLNLNNNVFNISRTAPEITHPNLTHYNCDVLKDEFPDIELVDTLIYCPGSINLKPISTLTIDDFRTDFEINVIGAVKAIKKYLKPLKNGNNPNILLFSTVATKLGMPYHASIAASKSAIEGLTKSLGAELAPTIRINAIAPTVTDTDLASKILRNDTMKQVIAEKHPLKRYLNTNDVVALADFLISQKSSAISGQIFNLDCGIVTFKI
ncbi:MAG: oxidoreductase [Flavobacteriales bacterium CG11_big_fil_rev_8_21_14_0_20_35_7]|nr:MAG: oxidoreductase [Flavobacteriales bacterium CG11_big_fil_rev_8_21_14_0_20_35_7]